MSRATIAVLVLLLASVVALQALHERQGGPPAGDAASVLYVRSPEAMKRLALSYDALVADVYWIRAIQHYGSTKLSSDPNKQYDLLYPLLDLTTSLDPYFNVAYHFGSVFLAEPAPGGPGRPDLAIALLEKALRVQPDRWEFAQAIGFVHYWWRQDYVQAADWFTRASKFPNAPAWMASLAAVTLVEGGNRTSSRILWQQIATEQEDGWYRREAERRLQQLDAMDLIDDARRVVAAFERRVGRPPSGWDDLRQAGYIRATPLDPTGSPLHLTSGAVGLAPDSPLNPLPLEPARLQ